MIAEQDGDRERAVSRGKTAATASCGDEPRSTSRATSGRRPRYRSRSRTCALRAISSSRSGLKFSMIPLWTSATDPTMCGCALPTVGAPCVAQRVWAMPVVPWSGSAPTRERDCRACPRPVAARARRHQWCKCRHCHNRDIRAASARRTGAARHRFSDNPDNSAHTLIPRPSWSSARGSACAQPAMPFCSLRSTARLSARHPW